MSDIVIGEFAENAITWGLWILTFRAGYLGKYLIKVQDESVANHSVLLEPLEVQSALVGWSGERDQEESVQIEKSPFPLFQSPGLIIAGVLNLLGGMAPFGSLVKLMAPSQNIVFKYAN